MSIAEQLRAEGYAEGFAQGLVEGELFGSIQVMELLLKRDESLVETLAKLDLGELREMRDRLRREYRERLNLN